MAEATLAIAILIEAALNWSTTIPRERFEGDCKSFANSLKVYLIKILNRKFVISFGTKLERLGLIDIKRLVYETEAKNKNQQIKKNKKYNRS